MAVCLEMGKVVPVPGPNFFFLPGPGPNFFLAGTKIFFSPEPEPKMTGPAHV